MIRNIVNKTGSVITIDDMNGMTLQPGESVDGFCLGEDVYRKSIDLLRLVLSGECAIFDGFAEHVGKQGVFLVVEMPKLHADDGKELVSVSARPDGFYSYITGAGDSDTVRGAGECVHLYADTNLGKHQIDAKFIEDVYVMGGKVSAINATVNTYITIEVIAPVGIPYPNKDGTGSLDYVNGSFVPNSSNTGAFDINFSEETIVFRFVNRMHLIGTDKPIRAEEPFLLRKPYFLRFKLQSDHTEAAAAVTLDLFRQLTV